MKRVLFFLSFVILGLVLMSWSEDDNDRRIEFSALPANAQSFITTHFPDISVSVVKEDNDSYDVYMVDGYEIEFNREGEWDSVDGNRKALPESFLNTLPAGITDYVKANYADVFIEEVDKESWGFEVGLNNDVDLMFNTDGSFRGIDR